tara:strand:- start:147 stop:1856 length:1710 start_codon:yes stop_codon:yes gene_type:complete
MIKLFIGLLLLFCFINLFEKSFAKSFNEGFGKMMQGKGKTGSVLSVPALCSDRTIEYCETTDGCKWNGSECNLKKGWTTGSIGTAPMYVPRSCGDRNPKQCEGTDGCKKTNEKCNVRDGYKEVKNIDGEVVYVPGQCSERTISECGSGKNCIWIQGKCIRRDAGQKNVELHAKQRVCYIDHKGVGFGDGLFVCSDKPMPLVPVKGSSGIPERPPSERKNIPILEQTKTCQPPAEGCNEDTDLVSEAANYIHKLQESIKDIKKGFEMCAIKCGRERAKCVDKDPKENRCALKEFQTKQECDNAWDGDTCKWVTDIWKPCTADCRKWNCENCKIEEKKEQQKRVQKQCMRDKKMQPIPFLRQRRKQPEKPEFEKTSTYSVVKPRVSEINIGMDLNSNLIPYNEKNYKIAGKKATPFNIPGKDFYNCMYKRPTAGLFNETFAGAAKCGLLGSNSLKCKKFEECQWFEDKKSFEDSELGEFWKEQNEIIERDDEKERDIKISEALKYLYENEPRVAKEFVKRILKLPPDVSRDSMKMIDFLQTNQGKTWSSKRTGVNFDTWVLDYMINFSSAK